MPQFGQLIQNTQGQYKKLILDLKNYINPISRENIQQMTTKEYSEQEEKILMQMNSIGIPTNQDIKLSQEQDYANDPTAQWVWILDDSKKSHCDFCLEMEGKTFNNEADAPQIPVHDNCGCQLIRCVMI